MHCNMKNEWKLLAIFQFKIEWIIRNLPILQYQLRAEHTSIAKWPQLNYTIRVTLV